MHRFTLVLVTLVSLSVAAASCSGGSDKEPACTIAPTLPLGVCALTAGPFSTNLTNPYFPMRLGTALVYDGEEDGEVVHLEILALDSTKNVAGVNTRVIEERETIDGALYEVSLNYFAQAPDGTVCYFGEDVDFYENGVIVGHDGAWLAGGSNQPGIQMPAVPHLGDAYSQEVAPGIAEDRAEVVGTNLTSTVPAGTFTGVLRNAECTPLERGEPEYKEYAPGVGLIVDAVLRLTSY